MTTLVRTALVLAALGLSATAAPKTAPTSADARSRDAVRRVVEDFRKASGFPGAVVGVYSAHGPEFAVAVGLSDVEAKRPMRPTDLLHGGSTGKTFFAALALQLLAEKRLALDDRVSKYLGAEPWFATIPNANDVTIRMLFLHTSGIPEYGDSLMQALVTSPSTPRTPLDAIRSVSGAKPTGPAGASFAYTDVNYQLLQLVCEKITGRGAYAEIRDRFLVPLKLRRIVPADRARIPGLVQGYDAPQSPFGERAVVNGAMRLDPRFEGGGGGFVANAGDLARWMADYCEGRAFDPRLLPDVFTTIPAPGLGATARSGLGVEEDATPLGPAYGHGGYFPGYFSQVRWYKNERLAIALMVNTSDAARVSRRLTDVVDDIARAVVEARRPR